MVQKDNWPVFLTDFLGSNHQNWKFPYLLQLFGNLFYQKEMKARSEALKTLEIKIKYSWCILENQDYTSSLTPFYTNKYSSVFQTMINN